MILKATCHTQADRHIFYLSPSYCPRLLFTICLFNRTISFHTAYYWNLYKSALWYFIKLCERKVVREKVVGEREWWAKEKGGCMIEMTGF